MNVSLSHEAMQQSAPRAAYVHVPFCRHRCGYCNFTVAAHRDDLQETYLQALELELRSLRGPHPVETLFFGGGTPSHLPPLQLRRLLHEVLATLPLTAGAEFSVEANPEDLDAEKVAVLREAGVNRVSLGVQSLDVGKLRVLERTHVPDTVARCCELLRGQISDIAMDLIFATPGESLELWRSDVSQVLALAPHHLSTYGLTFEKGTRFFARQSKAQLLPVPEEIERSMYEYVIDTLVAQGYEHYEVSNFALPGHRSRHNENYWLCGEYFGLGPGAASYVGGVRRSNHRSTTAYLKRVLARQSPVVESERLSTRDKAHERLVFGLRRLEGIDLDEFHASTGFRVPELVGANLDWLCDRRLLELHGSRLQLTREGLLLSDSIWPYLL